MVLADSGTPVWKMSNTGAVTGNVLQYGSSGQKIVCNTTTITGTGTLATGLATPSVSIANLGADANYDHVRVTTLNSAALPTWLRKKLEYGVLVSYAARSSGH